MSAARRQVTTAVSPPDSAKRVLEPVALERLSESIARNARILPRWRAPRGWRRPPPWSASTAHLVRRSASRLIAAASTVAQTLSAAAVGQ
eukprot:6061009-Pyramimonas_sp.AAC.1